MVATAAAVAADTAGDTVVVAIRAAAAVTEASVGEVSLKPRSTTGKRIRERERVEHQQEKLEKRKLRKLNRENQPAAENGEDPDLIGIKPGPQPQLFVD